MISDSSFRVNLNPSGEPSVINDRFLPGLLRMYSNATTEPREWPRMISVSAVAAAATRSSTCRFTSVSRR